MPPRQPKADTPDQYGPVLGGGNPMVGSSYDVLQRLTRVEATVTYLEASASDQAKKLDDISKEIAAAKASFSTLKWIGAGIFAGVWSIILMWAKHYFGW